MESIDIFGPNIPAIGYGSFSTVYKGYDRVEKKYYACKVFKDLEKDMTAKDLLNKEIDIISQIKHPLLLSLKHYGKVSHENIDKYVMVTNYYENGTLTGILNSNVQNEIGWNDTTKLIFIYMIAIEMSYLHSQKIVHRDLKPDNIYVNEYLQPIIGDFGISKAFDESLIKYSGFKGTVAYSAPEFFNEDYTPSVDVFSFAKIAYQIVTNQLPYERNISVYNLMTNVKKGIRPKIPKSVPLPYQNLIETCWDQDYSKRPTFDQIILLLEDEKNGFITETVNKEEFLACVRFCQQFKHNNYDPNKPIVPIFDFNPNIKPIKIIKSELNDDDITEFYNKGLDILKNISEIKTKEEKMILKKEAANNFKKAADNGHLESIFQYGLMLFNKDIIPENKENAADYYFRLAIGKGHVGAMYYYSLYLYRNEYFKMSYFFLEKAALNRHLDAMNEYADLLYQGIYFKKDKERAKIIFKAAADEGNVKSMMNYVAILRNELDSNDNFTKERIAEIKNEIFSYAKNAADKGNDEAKILVANIFEKGDGVPCNLDEADRYYGEVNNKKVKSIWPIIESSNDDFEFIGCLNKKEGINLYLEMAKATGQLIAVKCAFDDIENADKIETEYKNLMECQHPSIQKVVGFYRTNDKKSSVLHTYYYSKKSLDKYFKSKKFVIEKANSDNVESSSLYSEKYIILLGVCRAMKYLEDKPMFHGNLNPENILLDKDREPILNNIKMKESYTIDEIKNQNLLINYFAPEVISGDKATIKSDVYSFGLIINQLFDGKIPYDECKANEEIIENIINNKTPVISEYVPDFLATEIEKCLKINPNERPTFNELFTYFSDKFVKNTNILFYNNKINGLIQCPITFYRAPKMFISLPNKDPLPSVKSLINNDSSDDESESNENSLLENESTLNDAIILKELLSDEESSSTEETSTENNSSEENTTSKVKSSPKKDSSKEIGFNASNILNYKILENIFSTVKYNRVIKLIMVCGKFQSGKSTLLRTLTGNGAFFSGEKLESKTKGILIDGPYLIKDLTDRIARKDFLVEQNNLCEDQAIFFIDSQGIGDESSEVYSDEMKKYLSFFCSISDVCINIKDSNEGFKESEEIINILRTGQVSDELAKNKNQKHNDNDEKKDVNILNDITKIIFMIKDYKNMKIEVNDKSSFINIQKSLQKDWINVHPSLKNKLSNELLKIMPLGNPFSSYSTYNYSIWYIIPQIITFLNNTRNHKKDYIQNKIEYAMTYLFSDYFKQFSKKFKKTREQIDFIVKISFNLLNVIIDDYKKGRIDKDEAFDKIKTNFYAIKVVIIPFTIGKMKKLSIYEINQYTYDIMKDINNYLSEKLPELKDKLYKNFKEFFLNDVLEIVGGGFAASGASVASIIAVNIAKKALVEVIKKIVPLFIPGGVIVTVISVVSSCISIGSFAGSFINKYVKKNKEIESLKSLDILSTIPFLWEKIDKEAKNPRFLNSTNKINRYFKNIDNIIFIVEEGDSIFLKFIIQCMTGVETNYKEKAENIKESIVYGPFKPNKLIQRYSRYYPEFKSEIEDDVYILYLRCFDQNDFNQIITIQNKALFYMFSSISLRKNLIIPDGKNAYSFYSLESNLTSIYLTKNICSDAVKTDDQTKMKNFMIIGKNDFVEDNKIGPLTNKCLRWAFNLLLKRKKIIPDAVKEKVEDNGTLNITD